MTDRGYDTLERITALLERPDRTKSELIQALAALDRLRSEAPARTVRRREERLLSALWDKAYRPEDGDTGPSYGGRP